MAEPFPEDVPPQAHADDEDSCRVCRGAAQPERPLHRPCKCRGSIRHVHQDCLEDWLKRRPPRNVHLATGNPTCELCLAPFVFDLVYGAGGRPHSLPVCDVLNEMCGGVLRVIPFWLRTIFAASLWLILLPMMVGLNFQLVRLVAMNSSGLSTSLEIVVNFMEARFNAPSSLFSSLGIGVLIIILFLVGFLIATWIRDTAMDELDAQDDVADAAAARAEAQAPLHRRRHAVRDPAIQGRRGNAAPPPGEEPLPPIVPAEVERDADVRRDGDVADAANIEPRPAADAPDAVPINAQVQDDEAMARALAEEEEEDVLLNPLEFLGVTGPLRSFLIRFMLIYLLQALVSLICFAGPMILGRLTLNWFGGSAAISASILRAVAVSTSSPMANITADTPHLYQIAAGQYFLNASTYNATMHSLVADSALILLANSFPASRVLTHFAEAFNATHVSVVNERAHESIMWLSRQNGDKNAPSSLFIPPHPLIALSYAAPLIDSWLSFESSLDSNSSRISAQELRDCGLFLMRAHHQLFVARSQLNDSALNASEAANSTNSSNLSEGSVEAPSQSLESVPAATAAEESELNSWLPSTVVQPPISKFSFIMSAVSSIYRGALDAAAFIIFDLFVDDSSSISEPVPNVTHVPSVNLTGTAGAQAFSKLIKLLWSHSSIRHISLPVDLDSWQLNSSLIVNKTSVQEPVVNATVSGDGNSTVNDNSTAANSTVSQEKPAVSEPSTWINRTGFHNLTFAERFSNISAQMQRLMDTNPSSYIIGYSVFEQLIWEHYYLLEWPFTPQDFVNVGWVHSHDSNTTSKPPSPPDEHMSVASVHMDPVHAALAVISQYSKSELFAIMPELAYFRPAEELICVAVGYSICVSILVAFVSLVFFAYDGVPDVAMPVEPVAGAVDIVVAPEDPEADLDVDGDDEANEVDEHLVDQPEHPQGRMALYEVGPDGLPFEAPEVVRMMRAVFRLVGQNLKVVLMVSLDIIFLPLLLGWLIDVMTLSLFTPDRSASVFMPPRLLLILSGSGFWFRFTHWGIGVVTLGLVFGMHHALRRYVLPQVLQKFVRFPDEMKQPILEELFQTPLLVQLKRLLIHSVVLLFLIICLFYVPLQLTTKGMMTMSTLFAESSNFAALFTLPLRINYSFFDSSNGTIFFTHFLLGIVGIYIVACSGQWNRVLSEIFCRYAELMERRLGMKNLILMDYIDRGIFVSLSLRRELAQIEADLRAMPDLLRMFNFDEAALEHHRLVERQLQIARDLQQRAPNHRERMQVVDLELLILNQRPQRFPANNPMGPLLARRVELIRELRHRNMAPHLPAPNMATYFDNSHIPLPSLLRVRALLFVVSCFIVYWLIAAVTFASSIVVGRFAHRYFDFGAWISLLHMTKSIAMTKFPVSSAALQSNVTQFITNNTDSAALLNQTMDVLANVSTNISNMATNMAVPQFILPEPHPISDFYCLLVGSVLMSTLGWIIVMCLRCYYQRGRVANRPLPPPLVQPAPPAVLPEQPAEPLNDEAVRQVLPAAPANEVAVPRNDHLEVANAFDPAENTAPAPIMPPSTLIDATASKHDTALADVEASQAADHADHEAENLDESKHFIGSTEKLGRDIPDVVGLSRHAQPAPLEMAQTGPVEAENELDTDTEVQPHVEQPAVDTAAADLPLDQLDEVPLQAPIAAQPQPIEANVDAANPAQPAIDGNAVPLPPAIGLGLDLGADAPHPPVDNQYKLWAFRILVTFSILYHNFLFYVLAELMFSLPRFTPFPPAPLQLVFHRYVLDAFQIGTYMHVILSWLVKNRHIDIPGNRMLQVCLLTLRDDVILNAETAEQGKMIMREVMVPFTFIMYAVIAVPYIISRCILVPLVRPYSELAAMHLVRFSHLPIFVIVALWILWSIWMRYFRRIEQRLIDRKYILGRRLRDVDTD